MRAKWSWPMMKRPPRRFQLRTARCTVCASILLTTSNASTLGSRDSHLSTSAAQTGTIVTGAATTARAPGCLALQ
eukprot:1963283-Prymnesium_polylepis.1